MADDNCINYDLYQPFIYLKQKPKIMQVFTTKIETIKIVLTDSINDLPKDCEPSKRALIMEILKLIEKILELLIVLKSR